MALRTTQEKFAIVKMARHLISQQAPDKGLSAATKSRYAHEYRRSVTEMQGTATQKWEHLCQKTKSKNTYRVKIAAISHGIHEELGRLLYFQDQFQRAGKGSAWDDAIDQMHELLELDRLVSAAKGELGSSSRKTPLINPRPVHSKRQDLYLFPEDWRETLASQLEAEAHEYLTPYLVAALTGCRPHELQTGIDIQCTEDSLRIMIAGAKFREKERGKEQGQKERCHEWPLEHPFALRLKHALNLTAGGSAKVQVSHKGKFTWALRRVGRKIWSDLPAVTPYLMRHALAGELKASGDWEADKISMAMGHRSTRTTERYGYWRQRRGSQQHKQIGPLAISATSPVRNSEGRHLNLSAKQAHTPKLG